MANIKPIKRKAARMCARIFSIRLNSRRWSRIILMRIWNLNRGGHDPHKIHAAFTAAMQTQGRPTVILAKTIKGYGMGEAGEALNITHQQKKMPVDALRKFRDR